MPNLPVIWPYMPECHAGAIFITQVSPIAWQDINFYGRYEFTKGPEPINLDRIVGALAKQPILLVEDEA
jgi:hypothetical protein